MPVPMASAAAPIEPAQRRRTRMARCMLARRRAATLLTLRSTLLEANGIATPTAPAHVLAQGEPFDVAIWPPTIA